MGDPRKHRKKFTTPAHPWQRERIEAEKEIVQQYGVKRKYEIWKMNSVVKGFTGQAKKLMARSGSQADKERKQLIDRLTRLGLLKKDAKIEDVLGITLGDIMERRLQTVVLRRELARTQLQARQFIVHEHIAVSDKVITAPSYLVLLEEETNIKFIPNSTLSDDGHPERIKLEKEEKPKKKEGKDARKDNRRPRKDEEKKEETAAKPTDSTEAAEEKEAEEK